MTTELKIVIVLFIVTILATILNCWMIYRMWKKPL